MVKIKRVYEPSDKGDGLRVLVMRLWPRGIRKERVDLWLRELGADLDMLKAWKAGTIGWPERKRRYLAGLKRPEAAAQLAELRELAARGTVTLLCSCKDERQCHRSILKSAVGRARPRRRRQAE